MAADYLAEELPSRYVVGIDLGTTNSAVCYVDCQERPWRVRVLEIPQLVAPGQIEARDTLPSFHYQPAGGEGSGFGVQGSEIQNPKSQIPNHPPAPSPQPPTPSAVVGHMARDYGAASPGRLIASAKSWLCHTGVDRTAELLPWHAAEDALRISPVEASSRYLEHIRTAWNERFKSEPLERQDIVLTLPASFDEIARELTVQAAARAGLPRVVLIEEPQAAFYAWIYKHQENWDQLVTPGQKILVCDIGGGTTDFTLIRVRRGESTPTRSVSEGPDQGRIQFHRVAVGDHLLLGGDNMDLALAQHLEGKLQIKLAPRQWDVLLRQARQVKEQMLADDAPAELSVTISGSGSKLIGGALQTKITQGEVRQLLVEGFMPRASLNDKPAARRSGFQEFGLPYAADPAMTRYLAAFLTAHRHAGEEGGERGQEPGGRGQGTGARGQEADDPARPDVLLFNGGVFESSVLRQRLIDSLADWFGKPTRRSGNASEGDPSSALPLAPSPQPLAPSWQPNVLDNDRLDLAVARGAAYYGMVRRGEGVKIVASLARTYYIGVDSPTDSQPLTPDPRLPPPDSHPAALCLVPGSAEPGQNIVLDRQFDLLVSEPVEFPLYTSSIRLTDQPGELVPIDPEQMTALPPIRTALKTRSRRERGIVPVQLHARLTEIGTLDLWCSEVGGERTWRLQFDVRSATQTDVVAHETAAEVHGFVDESAAAACRTVLEDTFGAAGKDGPNALVKRLVAAGSERSEWPTSLLRRIWEILMELEPGRRKSPAHEARWLNLLGYALRPGYGLAVDDWRVAETWKMVQGKLAHGAATSRTESLILWRRIAGGLTAGQQRALAEPLLATVRTLHKRQMTGAGKGADPTFSPHETLEVLRLLGSLELLAVDVKIELGRLLLDLVAKKKLEPIRPAILWALGRLGAREPAYGPLNTVVTPALATEWVERLIAAGTHDAMTQFALVNLARKTNDRFRDVDGEVRKRVLAWLEARGASKHTIVLVRDGGQLDAEEQSHVFGEALPRGLRVK